jgi:hypothetical protein
MKRSQAMDDIARSFTYPERTMALDWVGMRGIDLPLAVALRDEIRMIHAQADVAVNLLETSKRGIHMSRLYKVIEGLSQSFVLMRDSLEPRLQEIMASHEECGTDAVQLELRFSILKRQQALVTEGAGRMVVLSHHHSSWTEAATLLFKYRNSSHLLFNLSVLSGSRASARRRGLQAGLGNGSVGRIRAGRAMDTSERDQCHPT